MDIIFGDTVWDRLGICNADGRDRYPVSILEFVSVTNSKNINTYRITDYGSLYVLYNLQNN